MLLGTHTPKLDDKGRVILPSKFRDDLGAGIVVTRGQERCLYVFSTRRVRAHPRAHPRDAADATSRRATSSACSSRARAPRSPTARTASPSRRPLRAYAGLERDLVVTGVGAHAEIWNADAWNAYAEGNEESYAELEQEVIPGLF